MPDTPTSKHCTICAKHKPLAAFALNAKAKDGHTSACSECRNGAARDKYRALSSNVYKR